jgi:hypothetical protein
MGKQPKWLLKGETGALGLYRSVKGEHYFNGGTPSYFSCYISIVINEFEYNKFYNALRCPKDK